jgi:uncharacterized membrane protein
MSRLVRSIIHQVHARPRLLSAIILGSAVALLLPSHLSIITRGLLAWDLGVMLYLILAVIMFRNATPDCMHTRAITQDDGAVAVLLFTVVAATVTLVAIIIELSGIKSYAPSLRYLHFGLGIVTLISSWAFIHTSFALHYAHDYYIAARKHGKPGLIFPDQPEPGYWDFAYFSFVIGMTSQTSDVAIATTALRRMVLLHGVIAFFFNAALLALAINAAASTL